MPHFIYFVLADRPEPLTNMQQLHEAGIDYVVPGSATQRVHTFNGPGGQAGDLWVIGRSGSNLPLPRYDESTQRWLRHPSGKYWVGVDLANKPGPEDLARKEIVGGSAVALLDGNEWIVPVCVPEKIKGMSGETLPMVYDLNEACETIERVDEKYKPIAERAYQHFEAYVGWGDRKLTFAESEALACDLLAINYQVGRLEVVGLLGLMGSKNIWKPIRAAIEADAIDAYAKERVDEKGSPEKKGEGPDTVASGLNSGSTGGDTPKHSDSGT